MCRNVAYSRQFSEWLDQHPISSLKTRQDLAEHRKMSAMHNAVSNKMVSLSSKLRLLPQNRYHANNVTSIANRTPPSSAPRPWDRPARKRRDEPEPEGTA